MIILVGPSASGKTEIGKALEDYGYKKLISYTTRKIRPNEKRDVDYHFVTKEEFMKKKEQGFFFETNLYNDNYYGTAKKDVNMDSYAILDPNGLKAYQKVDKVITFFIYASREERKRRMIARLDKEDDIERRLKIDDIAFDFVETNYSIDTHRKTVKRSAMTIDYVYNKELENGITMEFYDDIYPKNVLLDTRIATRGVVFKGNKIALIHIVCNDDFGNRDHYELPGGGLEVGETSKECFLREIKEELGIIVKDIKFIETISYRYNLIQREGIDDFYYATAFEDCEQNLSKREKSIFKQIIWIDIEQAIELLSQPNKNVGILVQRRDLYVLKRVLSTIITLK